MASTMQLEFTQAMTDFKTMFPEMDDDVIEAVLRANQGAVDATIDQLLTMSTDNQNERLRQEIEQDETGQPVVRRPAVKPAAKTPPNDNAVTTPASSKRNEENSLRVKKGWAPPLLGPLPPTFLRLPATESVDPPDLEDERIALFLQNEEFMAELRWNQDFLCALDKEQGTNEAKKGPEEEADFKERLRNMGKMSRKKFSQLSRVFTWQGNKKSNTSGAGGLLQEEHSDDDDRPAHSDNPNTHK